MMKWLREHNKQMLAVMTALILVSWLVGDPLRAFLQPDPSGQEIGRAFKVKITNASLVTSQNNTAILEALGINWRQLGGSRLGDIAPLRLEHWHLLSLEAKEAGIRVAQSEIDAAFASEQMAAIIDGIRKSKGVSLDQVREALADFMRIQRYMELNINMTVPSERQVRRYVRDTQDRVSVRVVTFGAKDYSSTDPLDPAEVLRQFEAHKANLPGENGAQFGYKFPRRVRIECLLARVDDVMGQVSVSEDEVRRYWRTNKNTPRFMKFVFETPASQPGTTAPAAPTMVQKAMSFSEARPIIETELKRRAAIGRVREAMDGVAADLVRPWLTLPTGKDGYKIAPEEARSADLLRSAEERMEKKYGIPLEYLPPRLMSAADIAADPMLGKMVSIGEGKDRLALAEFALRVPGFFDAAKAGETALRLALFQTPDAPLYNDRENQPYDRLLFRVVETAEPAVPASLDEVREKVEADVRFLRGLRAADARAREFFHAATNVGMDAAIEQSPDLKEKGKRPFTMPPFARRESLAQDREDPLKLAHALMNNGDLIQPPSIVVLEGARSGEFVDACFSLTDPAFAPPTVEMPTTTRPVPTLPAGQTARKLNLVQVARPGAVAVIELVEHTPVREDSFSSVMFQMGQMQLAGLRGAAARARWFDPTVIEQRCGFVRARTDDGSHVEATPLAPQPVEPGSNL